MTHAGSISHEKAEQLAHERFDLFDERRRIAETLTAEDEYFQELEILANDIPSVSSTASIPIIKDCEDIQLSIPEQKAFAEALLNPDQPNAQLLKSAKRHKKIIL